MLLRGGDRYRRGPVGLSLGSRGETAGSRGWELGKSSAGAPPNGSPQCRQEGVQSVLLRGRVRAGRAQLAQHGVDLAVDRRPRGRVAGLELCLCVVPCGLEIGDAGRRARLVAPVQEVAGVLGDDAELREVTELRCRGGRLAARSARSRRLRPGRPALPRPGRPATTATSLCSACARQKHPATPATISSPTTTTVCSSPRRPVSRRSVSSGSGTASPRMTSALVTERYTTTAMMPAKKIRLVRVAPSPRPPSAVGCDR